MALGLVTKAVGAVPGIHSVGGVRSHGTVSDVHSILVQLRFEGLQLGVCTEELHKVPESTADISGRKFSAPLCCCHENPLACEVLRPLVKRFEHAQKASSASFKRAYYLLASDLVHDIVFLQNIWTAREE